MRYTRKLVMIVALACILAACGSSTTSVSSDSSPSSVASSSEPSSSIEVDEGLLNVEIILPKSFLESLGTTAEEYVGSADLSDSKIKSMSANEDGSVSLEISKKDHRQMMEEMRQSFVDSLPDLQKNYPSVTDLEVNEDCTECLVFVDKEAYSNSLDAFVIWQVSLNAGMYQAFNGTNDPIVVNVIDNKTSEIIDSYDSESD